MGYALSVQAFNSLLAELGGRYKIYAPKVFQGKGRVAGSALVAYGEVGELAEIAFDRKTAFSPKEIIFPVNQTMFYFTKEEFKENVPDERGVLIFLRACDINGIERLDTIFLQNGPYRDVYYERLRRKVKFFLMDCHPGWESCFCVSLGSNRTENYAVYVRRENNEVFCRVKDQELAGLFEKYGRAADVEPRFVEKNEVQVKVPGEVGVDVFEHRLWQEYTARCSACGRCTVSCPTCTCFTIQDLFYQDNAECGERRRVWASCMIDGFTDMAGGVALRANHGDRLRYKTLHKIYDFKKRFGVPMCVGCGRCDDVCPEYISFSKCINKLGEILGR
ncbi:MAG: anaerobic sulfite reductase subunit AsrA [Armatimonadetes bacterium]|nr:anaerobic sulfite reductase subunit AsrA [Armatimonadota bacterium]